MRTAEQGQAAAPQEREHRRRYLRLPGRSSWAVGEYLSDCHKLWSANPEVFSLRTSVRRRHPALPWARLRSWFFVCCEIGLCGPKL